MKHMKSLVTLLSLVLLLTRVNPESIADAAYDPTAAYSSLNGASIPIVGVSVVPGACTVGGAYATNGVGATAYLMLFDSTTQPSSGTGVASKWQSASCTNGTVCALIAVPPGGIALVTGAYLAWSSQPGSYTAVASASADSYALAHR
jgi:hypothetical protein